MLPSPSGCCTPGPTRPGAARAPTGAAPAWQTDALKHPGIPPHVHPPFPSFPAIPTCQTFPASSEVFNGRVSASTMPVLGCLPTDAWLGGEERASTSTERRFLSPGIQPGLAEPHGCTAHTRGCPGPRDAHSTPCSAPGAPQSTDTPQNCPALPARPAAQPKAAGDPRAPQGWVPQIP